MPSNHQIAWSKHATRTVAVLELPVTDYRKAWRLQTAIVESKNRRRLAADVILFLEHPPVYTLGRRGGIENLVVSRELLEKHHIDVVQVERGGNITYHGPGQLVVYPIMDLNRLRLGVADLVTGLEELMIRTASDFGVRAERNPKNRGVWVGPTKLGSIGIAVRKGICFHGLALNVNPWLTPFEWIHPCGLSDTGMTSLSRELGMEIPMAGVRKAARYHLEKIFGICLHQKTKTWLEERLPADPALAASAP